MRRLAETSLSADKRASLEFASSFLAAVEGLLSHEPT
jgi:hypothetical protein